MSESNTARAESSDDNRNENSLKGLEQNLRQSCVHNLCYEHLGVDFREVEREYQLSILGPKKY